MNSARSNDNVDQQVDSPADAPRPRVAVVMPALNAARTLLDTYEAIPREVVDEIVLVDDKSSDETLEIARTLPIKVIWHPHNVGSGGNQKTCYLDVLQGGADVVVMLHPDGQYHPPHIPDLIRPIVEGRADVVLGSRMQGGTARAGGMPLWKWVANRFLTTIENRVLGTALTDAHTGYRAYSRQFLLTVPFLRNSLDFSFDSQILMQAAHFGFRIEEIPTTSRYFDAMSSVGFGAGTVYGLKTLWFAARVVLHRRGIWKSRKLVP
jgi:glycosyltransferase involved in cell wall biosynthesis